MLLRRSQVCASFAPWTETETTPQNLRRHIATEAVKPGAGIAVLRDAVSLVMDARTDLAHIAA
jgi:hypothetical protein